MHDKVKTINGVQGERDGFANRLRQALTKAGYPDAGVSEFARQYTARSPHAISLHGVRKWLDAETMPRQHHVESLASWLNCDPGWLRYGATLEAAGGKDTPCRSDLVLLNDLVLLSAHEKSLVRELVALLVEKCRYVD